MPTLIILAVIAVCTAAYEIKSTVSLVQKYRQSTRMLQTAQAGGAAVIRCENTAFDRKNPIIAICCNLGGCALMLLLLPRIIRWLGAWKLAFCLMLVYCISFAADSILKTVLNIRAIKREPFAYLTDDGMLCFWEVYVFGGNRFSWEAGENADTLHIYQPGKTQPLTFMFTEQQAEAHRIVDAHSTN